MTVTDPASNACGQPQRPRHVAGVQVGAEAVVAVVDLGDDLVLVGEAQHRQHRSEDLVAGEVAAVVDVAEDGRRDEVAAGQVAAERARRR